MNALIIGGAGFVGKYLANHLRERGWHVCVSKLRNERFDGPDAEVYDLDILEPDEIGVLLKKTRLDCIFHLAAQSSVSLSWKNPGLTIDVNVKGVANVLEAVRAADFNPRVLLIGSGEEYGRVEASEIPINEQNALRPGNIYAATKACQNMMGKIYADAYSVDAVMVRAFNHIGPGQSPAFVVSDFCRQTAEIEDGKREPVIYVGNLEARRDFTDVRDVVRAYGLLAENGERGETYNVGSGRAVTVRSILEKILRQSKTEIEVRTDKDKLRPVDVPVIEADISKLSERTGWKPEIDIDGTIGATLDYWRENI